MFVALYLLSLDSVPYENNSCLKNNEKAFYEYFII